MANDSNLMIALQQLITHKAGKKAFIDIQTDKIQLSETELKALADNPEFTESQKKAAITFAKTLHRNQVDADAELQLLLHNFEHSVNPEEKLAAWQALIDVVLKAYFVAMDDNVMFKSVREVIEYLTIFAAVYVDEFNGKLQNDKIFAAKIVKLLFSVANFYGTADQTENCIQWHDKAERFMLDNDLANTQEYAVLLNLRGEEALRRFKPYNTDGSLNKFPAACVVYYQQALDLHTKIGSTLAATPHMRHVQMGLAAVKAQKLQYEFEKTNPQTAEFKKYIKESTHEVYELLHDLYPTLGLDGYRIAQCLQIESQLYLLQGELSKAIEMATASIPFMPEKQNGQRSNLLNKVGNIYVAMANVLYQTSGNTESKFMIKQMADHPYTKLAQKLVQDYDLKVAPSKDLLAVADNFVVMATACYVKSYQLCKSAEQHDRLHSDQAKVALQQIGIENDLLDLVYFDQPLEELLGDIMGTDKIPEVGPGVAAGPSLTTMFTTTLQQGLNSFKDALLNVVYNPFAAVPTPPAAPQQKPKP